jgi:hypothetical protein
MSREVIIDDSSNYKPICMSVLWEQAKPRYKLRLSKYVLEQMDFEASLQDISFQSCNYNDQGIMSRCAFNSLNRGRRPPMRWGGYLEDVDGLAAKDQH